MAQREQLDYALQELDKDLLLWGLNNWLGYRTPETIKLSVSGATNLVVLVNTLNGEIRRFSAIVGEICDEEGVK